MASPLDTRWRAVKLILRYLSGTLDFGIQILKSNGMLSAFSDSDWAADIDDRRSTTGFCTYFGNSLISWCVKKQTVVARSSTEAEYRSFAHAAAEVTWLSSVLGELKLIARSEPVIWVDNLSAIALASNHVLHARTKHIELDIHFVRDKVLNKDIELRHVPSQDQVADIFTKPLGHQPFVKLRNKLGVVSLASLRLRGDVGRLKLQELREDLHEGDPHVDHVHVEPCTAKNESAREKTQHKSTGSLPMTAAANKALRDHSCTFKDVLLKGLKPAVC